MFQKLVAIEPIRMDAQAQQQLSEYAQQVICYEDLPKNDEEIIRRIGDADAVLVSYTTNISRQVIEASTNLRYIGMCCSLYNPQSANVDILAANQRGIRVLGIRDYGDEGVVEFVISELVRLLHGFGDRMWRDAPLELTGMKCGILGLGTTGRMVGDGLRFFGADVSYYSRTRKSDAEAAGYRYLPLEPLLEEVDILCTCLNKNVLLLHEAEFQKFGNGKILVNTSIGPSFDFEPLSQWLQNPNNYFICDTLGALGTGEQAIALTRQPNVSCAFQSSGMSAQAVTRLGKKVLENIRRFLGETGALS